MSETRRCTDCGHKLDDGYTSDETVCGACYSALMYQYEKARAEGREYLDLLPYETDEGMTSAPVLCGDCLYPVSEGCLCAVK